VSIITPVWVDDRCGFGGCLGVGMRLLWGRAVGMPEFCHLNIGPFDAARVIPGAWQAGAVRDSELCIGASAGLLQYHNA